MAGSFPASSFQPPRVAAAAASIPPRYPAWVLLDRKAYFADVENATSATATSRTTGHTVRVTFCLADPPSLSHFCVHGPTTKHLAAEPQVVFSDKDLVLLVFSFTGGDSVQDCEYFIYKAGRGNPSSLEPIPGPPPPGTRNTRCNVSMVARDDGDFLLAHLSLASAISYYDLSIFSSKTGKWVTRTLQVEAPASELRAEDLLAESHKVISLGGGMVGWVDLWRGVVACNLLADEDPFIYLIPLPKPGFNLPRVGDPKPVRDVTAGNGVIRFVEMEHYFRREVVDVVDEYASDNTFKVTKDLDTLDRMYDMDLLLLPHESFAEARGEQIVYYHDGWKIRTCYRSIHWEYWRKGHCVHVDDISATNPKHSSTVVPQLVDFDGNPTFRDLPTAFPTLGINGVDDHVVYLMSKLDDDGKHAWIVGVDLENKMLEVLEQYPAERARQFKLDCVACAFSEFLNTTSR